MNEFNVGREKNSNPPSDRKSLKIDEEKLVELVRRYSCLWQVSSTVFKDLWAKKNTWKEVDSQVQNYMEVNHKQFGTTICIYRANQL